MLSLVKRAVDSCQVVLTPKDMMRAIDKKLTPLFEKQGMVFKTIWVDQETFLHDSFKCFPSVIYYFVVGVVCLADAVSKYRNQHPDVVFPLLLGPRYVIGWASFQHQFRFPMLTETASPRTPMLRRERCHNPLHSSPEKASYMCLTFSSWVHGNTASFCLMLLYFMIFYGSKFSRFGILGL